MVALVDKHGRCLTSFYAAHWRSNLARVQYAYNLAAAPARPHACFAFRCATHSIRTVWLRRMNLTRPVSKSTLRAGRGPVLAPENLGQGPGHELVRAVVRVNRDLPIVLAPQSRSFVPPHHLPCPSKLPTSSQVCSAGIKSKMGEALHGVKTTAKIT